MLFLENKSYLFAGIVLSLLLLSGLSKLKQDASKQTMKVGYLEIVTPNINSVCKTYEKLHGVRFSKPIKALGNARIAKLHGGGNIGVRAPMRTTEKPIIRSYFQIQNMKLAIDKAKKRGAKIAFPPTKLSTHGTFAIFIQDGIQHGLWQPK